MRIVLFSKGLHLRTCLGNFVANCSNDYRCPFFVQVIDPFVTIEIFGIPADLSQERTRTVPHNGKNNENLALLVYFLLLLRGNFQMRFQELT